MTSLDQKSLFDVSGKVVLVTGGSRGIGKMIATGFVQNNAKVYISSRSPKACEATARELNELGPGTCISIPADMQKVSDVEKLVKEISGRETVLHVLVNNAGTNWAESIDTFPDAAFTKVMTLNLQRVFTVTQKCLPLLRAAAQQGGKIDGSFVDPARIINIGSVDGLLGNQHDTYAYAASKAGLHHLSRQFAGRLGYDGVHSNALACGAFQSKMMAETLQKYGKSIREKIPAGRIGTPADIAGTCLYLSSRAGAWVNGATIRLEGGTLSARLGSKL